MTEIKALPSITGMDGSVVYMNDTLKINLLKAKRHAKKYNGDLLICCDGEEGAGKSTFARQVAKFLDPTFTEDMIVYNSDDCIKLHGKGHMWQSILLDESKEDLDRKGTMSKKNKHFMNFLSQSRQCNKFLIVVLPSIYDLDKYVAEHRAKFLLHVYKLKGQKPGYFSFFGRKGIKRLFAYGQKARVYNVRPNFNGRFTKNEVVDLERYNQLKRAAIDKYFNHAVAPPTDEDEVIRRFIARRLQSIKESKEPIKVTREQMSLCFGLSVRTLQRYANGDTEGEVESAD
jgi:hypothetical protein